MVFIIGVLAAALTLFLNYCLGKPSGEFSPYEIFSSYTIWLSKKRLIKVGLWDSYLQQYIDGIGRLRTKHEIITFKNDFKKMIYEAADPFFTWERAVGMCPVCTGFWVSLITGICFTQNILEILIIILTSHLTIRVTNKFL